MSLPSRAIRGLSDGYDRRVTVHGLRRTFAVLLQDAGAPDSVIRQALGHAQQGVTEQHYLPRRDPVVQGWVDRIELKRAVEASPLPSGALLAPAPSLLQ